MRTIDRLFVQAFTESFEVHEPILEFGSHQLKPEGDPFQDLRPLFPGRKFIGSDMRPGPGVDWVQDATRLGIKDRSVGTVISVGTIEHVFSIFDAFWETDRVLSEKGVVIVTSVMDCGVHGYPSDYWRFTPEAFLRLLDPYPAKIVAYQGISYNPHAVFGIGFKGAPPDFAERAARFRVKFEQASKALEKAQPMRSKITRFRRLVSWRVFGSKDAYRKLRDEYVVGWHCCPV